MTVIAAMRMSWVRPPPGPTLLVLFLTFIFWAGNDNLGSNIVIRIFFPSYAVSKLERRDTDKNHHLFRVALNSFLQSQIT